MKLPSRKSICMCFGLVVGCTASVLGATPGNALTVQDQDVEKNVEIEVHVSDDQDESKDNVEKNVQRWIHRAHSHDGHNFDAKALAKKLRQIADQLEGKDAPKSKMEHKIQLNHELHGLDLQKLIKGGEGRIQIQLDDAKDVLGHVHNGEQELIVVDLKGDGKLPVDILGQGKVDIRKGQPIVIQMDKDGKAHSGDKKQNKIIEEILVDTETLGNGPHRIRLQKVDGVDHGVIVEKIEKSIATLGEPGKSRIRMRAEGHADAKHKHGHAEKDINIFVHEDHAKGDGPKGHIIMRAHKPGEAKDNVIVEKIEIKKHGDSHNHELSFGNAKTSGESDTAQAISELRKELAQLRKEINQPRNDRPNKAKPKSKKGDK